MHVWTAEVDAFGGTLRAVGAPGMSPSELLDWVRRDDPMWRNSKPRLRRGVAGPMVRSLHFAKRLPMAQKAH